MKPKLNKLITLLLLLSTFAFFTEAEDRVTEVATKELSKWSSLLPDFKIVKGEAETLNPYAQKIKLVRSDEDSTNPEPVLFN